MILLHKTSGNCDSINTIKNSIRGLIGPGTVGVINNNSNAETSLSKLERGRVLLNWGYNYLHNACSDGTLPAYCITLNCRDINMFESFETFSSNFSSDLSGDVNRLATYINIVNGISMLPFVVGLNSLPRLADENFVWVAHTSSHTIAGTHPELERDPRVSRTTFFSPYFPKRDEYRLYIFRERDSYNFTPFSLERKVSLYPTGVDWRVRDRGQGFVYTPCSALPLLSGLMHTINVIFRSTGLNMGAVNLMYNSAHNVMRIRGVDIQPTEFSGNVGRDYAAMLINCHERSEVVAPRVIEEELPFTREDTYHSLNGSVTSGVNLDEVDDFDDFDLE